MKWLKNYKLFKESKIEKPSYKNLITEICVSMVLLNNEFLDNLLDRGIRARYSENSSVFTTDLKNLLLAKNRLNLGKFDESGKCIEDNEISKVNGIFDSIDFDIEKDWDKLVSARITARNIIDKLLPDKKLNSDDITNIFWIGPNKNEDYQEDIVIETKDGKQWSFYLNKNLSNQKTASFNTFADDLIGADIDRLFKDYLNRWNKLTQEWIRIIYENANKNIQKYIERFIDPKRIDVISYFDYFDIKHRDPQFKYLGEFIKEFDKNILKFSDLMSEIWKNRETCFMDPERIFKEWMETKVVIMNSKILENLLTKSLKSNHVSDIKKVKGDWKLADGTVKMKLFKTLVEKMGCLERPIYFLGKNGDVFNLMPSRDFFRKYYDQLSIKFDYHVKFIIDENDEENNDFTIKIRLELEDDVLIDMFIIVKFSGGEMSGKLSSKYKFQLADNFNYLISKKELEDDSDQDI